MSACESSGEMGSRSSEDVKDLIHQWRQETTEVVELEDELGNVELEIQKLLLEKEMLEKEVEALCQNENDGGSDWEHLEALREELLELNMNAESDQKHSQELEKWCKNRSSRNKLHLDSLRTRVTAVRERETQIEGLLKLTEDVEHQQLENERLENETQKEKDEQKEASASLSIAQHAKQGLQKCKSLAGDIHDIEKLRLEAKEDKDILSDFLTANQHLHERAQEILRRSLQAKDLAQPILRDRTQKLSSILRALVSRSSAASLAGIEKAVRSTHDVL